jgi:hypothetical protein
VGFTPEKTIYKLVFDDPRLNGLEVRARKANMGDILYFGRAEEIAQEMAGGQLSDVEAAEKLREMYERFANIVVDWNVEDDDGEPVPISVDGFLSQEQDFLNMIIAAWMRAGTAVPVPLAQPSSDGDPSLVASIPMETLSPSLAS